MSYECDSALPLRPGVLKSLKELLDILGYTRVERPVFKWRKDAVAFLSLHSARTYESFSGVFLVIYRPNARTIGVYTRTNSWCSRWDLDQQIRTVRLLRRYFGGSFVTDVGTNRYWRNERPKMTPEESGCFLAFERFHSSIQRVLHYLAERGFPSAYSDPKRFKPVVDPLNPRLLSNNLIVPYLVAAFEEYFRSVFVVLAQFCANREALFKNARIPADRLAAIGEDGITPEEAVAHGMSFQNVEAICASLRAVDQRIDVAGVLRKPHGRRRESRFEGLQRLIARRHSIIHKSEFDTAFEDEDVARAMDDLYSGVRAFHEHLATIRGWSLDDLEPPLTPTRRWLSSRRSGHAASA